MKKILIIDDDQDLLFIMKRWTSTIKQQALEVETVDNGIQAKQLIKSQSWDVIITDVNLKECSGLEIAEYAQKCHKDCQILMVTGHVSPEVSITALNMHVQAFLLKPLDKEVFVDKIAELLQMLKKSRPAKKILAIGAHPDDIEIGCGGTLLRHAQKGDELCILTLTCGEKGGAASMRMVESKKASSQLNAHLVFGDLIDTRVSQGVPTIGIIENVIKEFQPDVVYTHSPNDAHQDHRNCFNATVVAARTVKNLCCYQSPSSTIDFKPTHFSDIGQTLMRKIDLIKCYHSQIEKCLYLKPSLIKASAEYWGRFSGYGMVEPFEVIRSA